MLAKIKRPSQKKLYLTKVFLITMAFFLLLLLSMNFLTKHRLSSYEDQLHDIDQQIEQLQEMQSGYEAKALRHSDLAQRLQFIDGQLQESKMHAEFAAENRKIAKKIQKDIDKLQKKRRKIVKKMEKRSS